MNARVNDTTWGQGKEQLLSTLAGLLQESFRLRYEGGAYAKLARAQGYADGFMRTLIDSGIASEKEILNLVCDVRRGAHGPATGVVEADNPRSVVAA